MEQLDISEKKLDEVAAFFQESKDQILSEEDAKVKLINEVLFEVLCWAPADLNLERHHPSGYSDYIVGRPDCPEFVIEAKKLNLLDLELTQVDRQRSLKLSGSAFKKVRAEITQSRSYADDKGLPFAVLTDGNAWIIFKTTVPGKNYLDAEAFVFPSLKAVQNSFSLFFDLLSKPHVTSRTYKQCFDEIHNPRVLLEQELLAPFEDSEVNLARKSDLAFDLDRVFDKFFGKMRGDDDPDLLIECFVETRESRIADFSLEKITARILGNIQAESGTVDERLTKLVKAAIAIDEGQTVFIVGPTGSGKTTFIDRFFRKTLDRTVRDNCVDVRISFLDAGGADSGITSWLIEALIEALEQKLYENGHPDYDDLKGMYYREYARRRDGTGAALYRSDKGAFQVEFGKFLDEMVEKDREGYLKRLLADVAKNRGKLPVLIIDNLDEFSPEQKTSIFQLTQALRRHVEHALVIFPITDKTAWNFSKSDIFGIYKSKSFFLPTPSPRDILAKRIEYLRRQLKDQPSHGTQGDYLLSKGIRVSIEDLDGFASALEAVFIGQENTAKTLGELSNYNIRRTLELARRVMTSAVFDIDELVYSYVSGQPISADYNRFLVALMKGDYQLFRPKDEHSILPVFQVDSKFRQSPLLALRILALLEATSEVGRSIDDKHLSLQSIVDYFDVLGVAESSVNVCLKLLLDAKLAEPFDMSVSELEGGLSIAITHAGKAHLNLALTSVVFVEQMALTTAIVDQSVADEISAIYLSSASIFERFKKIRRAFIDYIIREDSVFVGNIPDEPKFSRQAEVTARLLTLVEGRRNGGFAKPSWKNLTGLVDWFDERKGYGFVDVSGVSGQVFLHAEVLEASGFASISDGDDIICDVERQPKGLAISKIHKVNTDPDVVRVFRCEVVKIIPERGYGFAAIEGYERDAFFHYSTLSTSDLSQLSDESTFEAEVKISADGSTGQVRKILRFL